MKNKQFLAQNEMNNNKADDIDPEILELEDVDEWEDDDDSEWEDEVDLMCNLKWDVNNDFEIKKHGLYKTGKTPRSTYYDKWGPSGSFTKSAIGTSKITSFFPAQSNTDDIIKNLDDLESENEQSEISGLEEENLCKTNDID